MDVKTDVKTVVQFGFMILICILCKILTNRLP